jgi:DNA (cytosine-5)-methyltransferase 1
MSIPVIDLFAGPGGLGEGFSRCRSSDFEIAVSIEKDDMAFETLRLRAAHRALSRAPGIGRGTWNRWDRLVAEVPWNVLFYTLRHCDDAAIEAACGVAAEEAWHVELGPGNRELIERGISDRLLRIRPGRQLPRNAVLIGGPPCQAYSVVGRSRNRGTRGYRAEEDHRHFLYLEYLHVITQFRPAVFVMENVKGILTSRVDDREIFRTIRADLKRPDLASGHDAGLEYVLVALPRGSLSGIDPAPEDFIVEAERFGVPQARHRVIILGIRRDVFDRAAPVTGLVASSPASVDDVTADLPSLRAQLSHRGKGMAWMDSLFLPIAERALRELRADPSKSRQQVADLMDRARSCIRIRKDPGHGADRLVIEGGNLGSPAWKPRWFRDRPLQVLSNHESRSHMPSDLVRYLFTSSYGKIFSESPKLVDFPRSLLPEHRNVDPGNIGAAIFKDRFRVQIGDRSSMTVTSHIGKDGHAFIHPDPFQCRSLTVREAARLQTFPDTYVFLGNRTSQYSQVGNAVPPMLANQIADVVGRVMSAASLT